ncbi:MAG TPA: hypothetical protein DE179_04555 [Oceanospirillaceae bacterium]|mgnify:CR=1 FL=1|nr:hypothetical protein [Oceanospirillaceae bacterium]
MTDDLEKQINALLAECETAMSDYAKKTGANMFPEVINQSMHLRVPTSTMSAKAMLNLANDLQMQTAAAAQRAANLDNKMAEAADELVKKKTERALAEAEDARQEKARIDAKRKDLYRGDPNRNIAKKKLAPSYDGPITLGRVSAGSRRRLGH